MFILQQAIEDKSYNGRECDILLANWPAVLDIVMPDGKCNASAKAKKAKMFSTYVAAMDAFCAFDDEKDYNEQADKAQILADAHIEAFKAASGSTVSLYHHALHTHMIDDMRRLGNLLKFSCQSVEQSISRMLRTKKHTATHQDYIMHIMKRECARLEARATGMLTPRLPFDTRQLFGLRARNSPKLGKRKPAKVDKPSEAVMTATKAKREKEIAAAMDTD